MVKEGFQNPIAGVGLLGGSTLPICKRKKLATKKFGSWRAVKLAPKNDLKMCGLVPPPLRTNYGPQVLQTLPSETFDNDIFVWVCMY